MRNFKVGDYVTIIADSDPNGEYLIGKTGRISKLAPYLGACFYVKFDMVLPYQPVNQIGNERAYFNNEFKLNKEYKVKQILKYIDEK